VQACIYMHNEAPEYKAAAIRSLGAEVIRMPGTYDDAVRAAAKAARDNGWFLIADTGDDDDPVVNWVMQGYGVMALELLEQFGGTPPTHVVMQGGVGGLAAGISGVFSEVYGAGRPTIIVVEPDTAGCLFESALQFRPARVEGDLKTEMHMLSAGEASPVAWPVVQARVDAFVTIEDQPAIDAARRLNGQEGLDIGVTGAASLAGLIELMGQPQMAALLGLDATSRVLGFGTEAGPPKALSVAA
jgi:diaminopropionate ammonia-lyase family